MGYIMKTSPETYLFKTTANSHISRLKQGFTLVELMVAIAVVAILSTIALPSLNDFLVKMRVDNEITEMQRLLLTARNMAINTGKNTTVCPLSSGSCTSNWGNEISVFTVDEVIKVKGAIKSGDKLQFTSNSAVVYDPSGRLITPIIQSSFKFCPKDNADLARGIDLSISGRSYISSDTDNDGKDENRSAQEITCS